MKKLVLIILVIANASCSKSWQNFKLTEEREIIAYEFDGADEFGILCCLRKHPERIKDSVRITQNQNRRIYKLLGNEKSYGNKISSNFNPGFGLVYKKNGKIIDAIDVSLENNYLKSSFQIPAMNSHIKLINDKKVNSHIGFSPEMRNGLNELIKDLGFLD